VRHAPPLHMFDMQNAVLLALQALVRHISSAAACQITMPLDATLLGLADSSIRPSIRSLRQTTYVLGSKEHVFLCTASNKELIIPRSYGLPYMHRRDSLASTWRSQKCGRLDYEQRASSALQLKLKELGPALLPALQVCGRCRIAICAQNTC
jgi:hypothetical protein